MEKIETITEPGRVKSRRERIRNARRHQFAAEESRARLQRKGDRAGAAVWDHLACLYDEHQYRLQFRADRFNTTARPREWPATSSIAISTPNLDAADAVAKIMAKGGGACTP